MKVMLIDTAHHPAKLWLAEGNQVMAEKSWENDRRTGILLLEALEAALGEVKWGLSDIERIGVHAGPGGYSSLRAGVISGEMLGLARAVDVIALRSENVRDMVEEMQTGQGGEVVQMRYKEV